MKDTRQRTKSMIGRLVGDQLEIVRLLGSGGMGEVYLARHQVLEVNRAVKLVRADLVASEKALARFRREALSLSRLQHENIVRVLDFGKLGDGSLFLVMEYIEGADLHGLVRKSGPLSLYDGVKVLLQASSALDYAHGQGIVHRDLKPANILLMESNPSWVRIIDFGLVKLVSEEMLTKLTQDNQVLGTPLFMAPEQCMGGEVGPPADVYAMAGIVYFLFSGQAVFPGLTPMATVLAHYEQEPEPINGRCPHLGAPSELEDLLLQCLAKNPDARPSAGDLTERLTGLLPEVSEISARTSQARAQRQDAVSAESPPSVARQIWARRVGDSQESSMQTSEQEVIREALANQITAVLLELSGDLTGYLEEAGWVERELAAIRKAEETVTELAIEKALVDSQLMELDASQPTEAARIRYRQRQLREHVAYLTHGLTRRYISLYDDVAAYENAVSDPSVKQKYEEMDGLIRRYVELLER